MDLDACFDNTMQRTIYTEDHEAFRESVKAFVQRHVDPRAETFIEQRYIDRELWEEAGKQGYLGLDVPEEFGGSSAGDYRYNAVLQEELARSSATWPPRCPFTSTSSPRTSSS